jgi:hypothetical protein
VLDLGQHQPDSAAPNINGLLDRLTAFEIHNVSTALGHLKDSRGVGERDFPGQRCFQVLFEKLQAPAVTQHEVHVNLMAWLPGRIATGAIFLTEEMRRW